MTLSAPKVGEYYQGIDGIKYQVLERPKLSDTGLFASLYGFTGEQIVFYQSLEDNQVWVSSLEAWCSTVTHHSVLVPKFSRLPY